MQSEVKQCQNCNNDFTIESEDFSFYEKIDVPAPTFCSECRMIRRMMWRNERTLYKRKNDAPEGPRDIISIYHPDTPVVVYDKDYWWSDNWDATDYGTEYDFSRPFFEQYKELLQKTPLVALFDSKSVNSQFCNIVVNHKDCYLVSAGWENEDSMYSNRMTSCKETVDAHVCHALEFGYENVYCRESNKLRYSIQCKNCTDSFFLYDCRGCTDCICCTNLRNKSYCIFNEQLTKEEYKKRVAEMNLGSRETLKMLEKKFGELYKDAVHKYAQLTNTENVVGDQVEDARNCYWCFDMAGDVQNCKYCHWAEKKLSDSYDTGPGTGGNSELTYEGISIGVSNTRCMFGAIVWWCQNAQYAVGCDSCNNIFGCVSLQKKDYCILNKQYTKEEYNELVPKIRQHMMDMPYVDSKGREYRYGEMIPSELSPWGYNETVAQDYFPKTKEEAVNEGYPWVEEEKTEHAPTIQGTDLPDTIAEVDESILNEIIACEKTGQAFRIVSQELSFYQKMNLPLPTKHPNVRHTERLARRNPYKLWKRITEDGVEVMTSYSPNRPEKIYSEEGYNRLVN